MLGRSANVKAIKFINLMAFLLSLALRLWVLFRESDCFYDLWLSTLLLKKSRCPAIIYHGKKHTCILK